EPIPSARQPRPKRVAEKVELLVWVVAASVIVLAIDGLSFCPDAALARIPRTAAQAMPATSLPAPHCDNGRSHRRHNARTGWPDGSAASRYRTCNAERDSTGSG